MRTIVLTIYTAKNMSSRLNVGLLHAKNGTKFEKH